jgi:hypothetical protein
MTALPNGHFGQHFITTHHCEEFSFLSSPARHMVRRRLEGTEVDRCDKDDWAAQTTFCPSADAPSARILANPIGLGVG